MTNKTSKTILTNELGMVGTCAQKMIKSSLILVFILLRYSRPFFAELFWSYLSFCSGTKIYWNALKLKHRFVTSLPLPDGNMLWCQIAWYWHDCKFPLHDWQGSHKRKPFFRCTFNSHWKWRTFLLFPPPGTSFIHFHHDIPRKILLSFLFPRLNSRRPKRRQKTKTKAAPVQDKTSLFFFSVIWMVKEILFNSAVICCMNGIIHLITGN